MADTSAIFAAMQPILAQYSPPFHTRIQSPHAIDLWAEGDFDVMGQTRKEMFFASAIIMSDYVGLYYMPIYADVESIKKTIPPRLLAMLKGKACFHIREWDNALAEEVKIALKNGFAIYKARGWV